MSRVVATIFSVAVAGLLLVPRPVTAASVVATWRAEFGWEGAYGSTTLTLSGSGTGSALTRLRGLPAGTATTVTVRSGTCARPGASFVTLRAGRTGSSGKAARTANVPAATMARIVAAPATVAVLRAGSFTTCADLTRAGLVAPSA